MAYPPINKKTAMLVESREEVGDKGLELKIQIETHTNTHIYVALRQVKQPALKKKADRWFKFA
jgi:hypothetical protein